MAESILQLLEQDGRLTPEQIALMCDKEVGDVRHMIEDYEKAGVILGYQALIDWDKTERDYVSALIEIKIIPQKDRGFDRVAEKIYRFSEVQSVYLMSGGFDLAVLIEGRTMKEVAYFVARKLAPLEDVQSTATHFVLRKYKDKGVIYGPAVVDERGNCL